MERLTNPLMAIGTETFLHKLFPFYLLLDRNLHLVQAGRGWVKMGLSYAAEDSLESWFKITRPRQAQTFETLQKQPGLVMMDCLFIKAQVKMQFTYLPELDALLAVGTPVVSDVHQLKELGLSLQDFPTYDYVHDLMFLAQIHHKTIDDVKKLNAQLSAQNHSLLTLQNETLQMNEELMQQNEEILAQRDELEEQQKQLLIHHEELKQQQEEILSQRDAIDTQTRELAYAHKLQSSVSYAKHIQHAMLPPLDNIRQALPESFVLWKPKDIVSGDFYWFSEREDHIIIAAVDCTGHGVPGAFMSMIGNGLLNEIVNFRSVTEPAAILNELDKGIKNALKQEETSNRDGMDIALCLIDKKEKILKFAGAQNSLVYVQQGILSEIKGNPFHLGASYRDDKKIFTQATVSLEVPGSYYIFSDGYADQFGGEHNKRFMRKNLNAMLEQVHDLPARLQYEHIRNTLQQWQGNNAQLDDILVIGFKI